MLIRRIPIILLSLFPVYFTAQPHVYESLDGGTSWSPDTTGLPNMPVYSVVMHDASTFIIGTELGIWTWNGSQWSEDNGGFERVPTYRIIEKPLYQNGCPVLYIGVHGRGMWRSTTLTPSSCQTAIGTGINDIKSSEISGLNIFPNPVSNASKVSITLSGNSSLTLRIVDMSGKTWKETRYLNTVAGKNLFDLNANGLAAVRIYWLLQRVIRKR